MPPAFATPRCSAYKTARNAVITETEPAALEACPQHDDDYVYVRVAWKKMAEQGYSGRGALTFAIGIEPPTAVTPHLTEKHMVRVLVRLRVAYHSTTD